MTINAGAIDGSSESTTLTAAASPKARAAYVATYRGPHGDAPGADRGYRPGGQRGRRARLVSPALVEAHYRLGRQPIVGETRVAVYADDDPGGFGPALQIVTDHAPMLMDSVTVLLHRLGVAYRAIMNPVFQVRRGAYRRAAGASSRRRTPASGTASTRRGSTSSSRGSVDRQVAGGGRAPAAQRPRRCPPGCARLGRAGRHAARPGRRTRLRHARTGSPARTARTSPRCCAGWPTDISCCWAISAARSATGSPRSIRPAGWACCGCARDVLPQLTASDDLLVLAQATMPSYPALRRLPLHRGGPRDTPVSRMLRPPSSTVSSGCSPWPP